VLKVQIFCSGLKLPFEVANQQTQQPSRGKKILFGIRRWLKIVEKIAGKIHVWPSRCRLGNEPGRSGCGWSGGLRRWDGQEGVEKVENDLS